MTAETNTDPVAAYLAAVHERWGTAENATWHDYATALEHLAKALRSLADVPRLLGAVEAVLALHKPEGYTRESRPCGPHRGSGWRSSCPACGMVEYVRCWQSGCPDEWPCPTYAAIAKALLGEVPADEH